MPRFSYYIAAHHKQNQLRRLVNTLRHGSPDALIVLHLDNRKSLIDTAEYAAMPNVHIIPDPTRVEWGLYSQLEMNFNTLSWMAAHLSFDWVVYLSGQDYPLMPLETIETSYRTGGYDGYLSGVPLDSGIPCDPTGCRQTDPALASAVCSDCHHRYHYGYYDITAIDLIATKVPLLRRFYRKFEHYASRQAGRLHLQNWPDPARPRRILGVRNDKIFGEKFRCYKGSAWFSLNRRAVDRLLKFLDENPSIVRHFKRTLIADEMVIQTILCNQPDLSIHEDNMRFISWESCHAPHPTTLTSEHFEMLASSGKHFARKFDIDIDAGIFDLLDQRVTGSIGTIS